MQGQRNENNILKKELSNIKAKNLKTEESLGEYQRLLETEIKSNVKLQSRVHKERLDRLNNKDASTINKKLISEVVSLKNQSKIIEEENVKLRSNESNYKKETSNLRTKLTQRENIINNLQMNITEINNGNENQIKRKERTIGRVNYRIKTAKKHAIKSKRTL